MRPFAKISSEERRFNAISCEPLVRVYHPDVQYSILQGDEEVLIQKPGNVLNSVINSLLGE